MTSDDGAYNGIADSQGYTLLNDIPLNNSNEGKVGHIE